MLLGICCSRRPVSRAPARQGAVAARGWGAERFDWSHTLVVHHLRTYREGRTRSLGTRRDFAGKSGVRGKTLLGRADSIHGPTPAEASRTSLRACLPASLLPRLLSRWLLSRDRARTTCQGRVRGKFPWARHYPPILGEALRNTIALRPEVQSFEWRADHGWWCPMIKIHMLCLTGEGTDSGGTLP